MGTEPKMAVSITIAKMNPDEMKKEGGEEPKAEGAEPETHKGLIKDKKVVELLDLMKELKVSDELIESVEADLGVEEEEQENLEKEGKDEGSEAEGDGVGPNGEIGEMEIGDGAGAEGDGFAGKKE